MACANLDEQMAPATMLVRSIALKTLAPSPTKWSLVRLVAEKLAHAMMVVDLEHPLAPADYVYLCQGAATVAGLLNAPAPPAVEACMHQATAAAPVTMSAHLAAAVKHEGFANEVDGRRAHAPTVAMEAQIHLELATVGPARAFARFAMEAVAFVLPHSLVPGDGGRHH